MRRIPILLSLVLRLLQVASAVFAGDRIASPSRFAEARGPDDSEPVNQLVLGDGSIAFDGSHPGRSRRSLTMSFSLLERGPAGIARVVPVPGTRLARDSGGP